MEKPDTAVTESLPEQVNTNTLVHLVLLVLGETGFVAAKKQNKKNTTT